MRSLAFSFCVFLVAHAKAQESYGISVHAGADFIETKSILYNVVGQYRGVKSDYAITKCYRLGVAPEVRFNRFRAALSGTVAWVPYSETVHRYQLYYSPGGNAYGGDIFYHSEGSYLIFELGVGITQMIHVSEKINVGLVANAATGRELIDHYRYASFSSGLLLEKSVGNLEFALSPQAVIYPLETSNYFALVGGRIVFSVRFQMHNERVKE